MPVESWLIGILLFMIAGSIVALEMKDILSAIVAIGVVGLGVSLAFLLLQAPDLAVVQFLFEIFGLIILVRAFIRRKEHADIPANVNRATILVAAIAMILILVLSLPILGKLPPFGQPLMTTSAYYLEHGLKETGAANLVSGIVLDYRAYDTLGEVTVLFTAILGTLVVLRKVRHERKEKGK
jgi:multicomponent Na+:H+ antiporter subunit B